MSFAWMVNQLMLSICHLHLISLSVLSMWFAHWVLIGCDISGLPYYWLCHFSWPGKKVLGLPRPVKQGQPRCPWKSLDDKVSSNVLEVFTECAYNQSIIVGTKPTAVALWPILSHAIMHATTEYAPDSAVEIYSVSDDTWTRGPDMPGTIAGTRAIQLEDTFQVSRSASLLCFLQDVEKKILIKLSELCLDMKRYRKLII